MLEFYQQKSLRSYLRSPLALILLSILCLLMARIVYARYTIEREMAARQLQSETEFQALLDRKKQLEEKVKYLSNDRGIEAEMRPRVGLVDTMSFERGNAFPVRPRVTAKDKRGPSVRAERPQVDGAPNGVTIQARYVHLYGPLA